VSSSLQDIINTSGSSRSQPDAPICSLTNEVVVLSGLLERVDKVLRECHVQALTLAHVDETLWGPIGNTMMDCKATLEALGNWTQTMRSATTPKHFVFRRSGIQTRLDAKSREVSAFSNKVYKSSCALQMVDAVVNM